MGNRPRRTQRPTTPRRVSRPTLGHVNSVDQIVVNTSNNAREWVLIGVTGFLALVTAGLWASTRRMAEQTGQAARKAGNAAEAALASVKVAEENLKLESVRWQIQITDRREAQARATEVHWYPQIGGNQIQFEFVNLGNHTIHNIVLHVSAGGQWSRSQHPNSVRGNRLPPWQTFVSLVDGLPITAGEMVSGCATFDDFEGRSWVKYANEGAVAPYNGDLASLVEHWVDPMP